MSIRQEISTIKIKETYIDGRVTACLQYNYNCVLMYSMLLYLGFYMFQYNVSWFMVDDEYLLFMNNLYISFTR